MIESGDCSDMRAEDKPHDCGLGARGKGGLLSKTENPGDKNDSTIRTPTGRSGREVQWAANKCGAFLRVIWA